MGELEGSDVVVAGDGSGVAHADRPILRGRLRRLTGVGPISDIRRLGFRQAVWLFPAAFALHVLEEAPRFTEWVNRYASDRYTPDDFVRNNGLGLALAVGSSVLASRFPNRPVVFLFFAAVFTQQTLFNPLFHAGSTVAFRAYSPGLVTALILFLPLWYELTRLALREGRLTRKGALATTAIAGVIHAVVIAQQVFFVEIP